MAGPLASPGARAVLAAGAVAPALGPEALAAFIGGAARPPWMPVGQGEVSVCRVADALWRPRWGAVEAAEGRLYASTVREAQEGPDSLAALPQPAAAVGDVAAGAVFMPWGAVFNYGHFLLDALPSLLALEEAGLLRERVALTPPLKPWQRELLRLSFGEALALREVDAPAVRVRDAVFATSMDHHLNRPSRLLRPLRERIRARAAAAGAVGSRPRRIYLSRRSQAHTMRIMVNEAALERALARRGFAVVRPETLDAGRQAALMLEAEIIVGPTGAALANAALAAPGAKVVEIQPETFVTSWVWALSRMLELDYSLYFVAAPLAGEEAPLLRRIRRGFRFAYRVPLDGFLAFLDARL